MSLLIIFLLYGGLLYLDYLLVAPAHPSQKSERIVYRVLLTLALLTAIPTGIALRLDHVGASLSGLISLFSR